MQGGGGRRDRRKRRIMPGDNIPRPCADLAFWSSFDCITLRRGTRRDFYTGSPRLIGRSSKLKNHPGACHASTRDVHEPRISTAPYFKYHSRPQFVIFPRQALHKIALSNPAPRPRKTYASPGAASRVPQINVIFSTNPTYVS